ncbi:hypothetical protein LTR66_016654, partial [Elasticomyces elasticus]
MCLSSRPEIDIARSMKNVPSLTLQNHTLGTIETFVRSELKTVHEYHWDPHEFESAVGRITQDANGVFLWATLVCADVIEGLLALEALEELQTRIHYFPPGGDLHMLYQRILDKTDPRTKPEVATILRLLQAYPSVKQPIQYQITVSPPTDVLTLQELLLVLEYLGTEGVIKFPKPNKLSLDDFRIRLQARLR